MDFDLKGIKWKLKIWFLVWTRVCFKNFITITVKMVAKKASLHIYGVRKMFNLVYKSYEIRSFQLLKTRNSYKVQIDF